MVDGGSPGWQEEVEQITFFQGKRFVKICGVISSRCSWNCKFTNAGSIKYCRNGTGKMGRWAQIIKVLSPVKEQ